MQYSQDGARKKGDLMHSCNCPCLWMQALPQAGWGIPLWDGLSLAAGKDLLFARDMCHGTKLVVMEIHLDVKMGERESP